MVQPGLDVALPVFFPSHCPVVMPPTRPTARLHARRRGSGSDGPKFASISSPSAHSYPHIPCCNCTRTSTTPPPDRPGREAECLVNSWSSVVPHPAASSSVSLSLCLAGRRFQSSTCWFHQPSQAGRAGGVSPRQGSTLTSSPRRTRTRTCGRPGQQGELYGTVTACCCGQQTTVLYGIRHAHHRSSSCSMMIYIQTKHRQRTRSAETLQQTPPFVCKRRSGSCHGMPEPGQSNSKAPRSLTRAVVSTRSDGMP